MSERNDPINGAEPRATSGSSIPQRHPALHNSTL